MTDITRLLASLKRRSAHAKEFGDDVTFVKLEDIDALVEALEKAQRANAAQDDHINQQQDRIKQLEKGNQYAAKRIAELEEAERKLCAANVTLDARAELAERQLAEMESRTVTVKLPAERFCPAEYAGSQLWSEVEAWNKAISACAKALAATGIHAESGKKE
ncbi:hypothetical protein [Klebsiella aerogenes]|uniref:hypothetical protein n=1 Tax=Klebsiella aerogenes TaxID=548 RepID=UPI00063CE98B|nr:hypothetical protein [Klebsiella aerogenes]KLF68611.1 hypothetical protein YA38_16380 [Klebsiella aerogenes]